MAAGGAAGGPALSAPRCSRGGRDPDRILGAEGGGIDDRGSRRDDLVQGGETELGRITPEGKLESVALSGHSGYIHDLVLGPEGNLWATTSKGVERITPAGEATFFPLPEELGLAASIAVGPGGGIWFTSWRQRKKVPDWSEWTGPAYVARIAPDGQVESFELPGEEGSRNTAPGGIALGPNGNLWVTDPALGRIDRVSPRGEIASFRLRSEPRGIAAGPDGALWFNASREIGRITTAGRVSTFPLRGYNGSAIAAGPDGNLWFAGAGLEVGRITPWGQVSWFGVQGGADVLDVVAGADGNVWAGTSYHPVKFITNGSISKLPIGRPGIEIASAEATVRDGRFDVVLECGGSPVHGCAGQLRMGWGKTPAALASYALPPESRRTVQLRLSAAAHRRLSQRRFQRQYLIADVEGGERASVEVVLRVPRPLRREVRPGQVVQIPLPRDHEAGWLSRGLGGDLWFTEQWSNRISRISPAGRLRSYRLPTPGRRPTAVTRGPLRSMWFLVEGTKGGGKYRALGRLSSSGRFSEIPLPGESHVEDLVADADGNLWVARTGLREGEIDRVTPGGKVTRFPAKEPGSIVRGPGGVWFTAADLRVGRITSAGKMTMFQIPGRGYLNDIAAGPDGNLWFTQYRPNRLVRLTPGGKMTRFELPKDMTGSGGLTVGPDGNLWFVDSRDDEVVVFGLPR
ncbi:MAG: hypothetical protein M3335_01390 [Actinomycetota bacterium]|nr:hypothetical protein [Actinomycetota bacterium]